MSYLVYSTLHQKSYSLQLSYDRSLHQVRLEATILHCAEDGEVGAFYPTPSRQSSPSASFRGRQANLPEPLPPFLLFFLLLPRPTNDRKRRKCQAPSSHFGCVHAKPPYLPNQYFPTRLLLVRCKISSLFSLFLQTPSDDSLLILLLLVLLPPGGNYEG